MTTPSVSAASAAAAVAVAPSSHVSYRIREYEEEPLQHKGHKDNTNSTDHIDTPWREYRMETSHTGSLVLSTFSLSSALSRAKSPIFSVAKDLFLPVGYPSTVRDGYLEYQLYDSLQGLCSYLRGVLCSARVLQAAGVGDASATALGAALTWALKDGAGMLGGLAFSYVAATRFDAHVKEFRLFADVINDVAMTIDMAMPYFGNEYLLVLSSTSTLCKTMCGMSAGATKSSITVHFAVQGNMADLNAKEGTQETLVSFIGMMLGVTLAQRLQTYQEAHEHLVMPLQWTIFTILTVLHVWANYQGVRLLRLNTLNRARAQVLLDDILGPLNLDSTTNPTAAAATADSTTAGVGRGPNEELPSLASPTTCFVPAPSHVYESLWTSTYHMLCPTTAAYHAFGGRKIRWHLQASLADILQCDPTALQQALPTSTPRYILAVNCPDGNRGGDGSCRIIIMVSLLTGAANTDVWMAFCHVLVLTRYILQQQQRSLSPYPTANYTALARRVGQLLQKQWFDHASSIMTHMEQQGWDVQGRLYLGFSRRRSTWMQEDNSDNSNKKDD